MSAYNKVFLPPAADTSHLCHKDLPVTVHHAKHMSDL